jgi:hypothetical protein
VWRDISPFSMAMEAIAALVSFSCRLPELPLYPDEADLDAIIARFLCLLEKWDALRTSQDSHLQVTGEMVRLQVNR